MKLRFRVEDIVLSLALVSLPVLFDIESNSHEFDVPGTNNLFRCRLCLHHPLCPHVPWCLHVFHTHERLYATWMYYCILNVLPL